jgi:hypothetical protein
MHRSSSKDARITTSGLRLIPRSKADLSSLLVPSFPFSFAITSRLRAFLVLTALCALRAVIAVLCSALSGPNWLSYQRYKILINSWEILTYLVRKEGFCVRVVDVGELVHAHAILHSDF